VRTNGGMSGAEGRRGYRRFVRPMCLPANLTELASRLPLGADTSARGVRVPQDIRRAVGHSVNTPSAESAHARPIIVHSHVRWDFVWQRPQQLFSRFARHRDVLFVEEPRFLDDCSRPTLEHTTPQERLHRLVPRLPASYRDSESATHLAVRSMVQGLVSPRGMVKGPFPNPIQWFYTPMIAPSMLGAFGETAVVYDCMDALARFRFSPMELVPRERYLLARADIVFTDSRVLADAKGRYHEHVYDFGCGVDAEHFAAAMTVDTDVPEALRGQVGPILGYIGAVDERLDYVLIAHLAEQIPESTIALVGPIVKVDPRDLPRRANIRYLGQQPHDLLPAFLKSFDVSMMPFVLSKTTAYINPTRTLEVLASGIPIVSTAITDVVRTFSEEVMIAESAREFVEAVRMAVHVPDIERRQRGLARARGASWEAITAEMSRLMDEAIGRRERHTRGERRSASAGDMIDTPVIGRPRIEREAQRAV